MNPLFSAKSEYRCGKRQNAEDESVSLYLYYIVIIKFNVVPETNHTRGTTSPHPQHTVPARREKTEKGTNSFQTENKNTESGKKRRERCI